MTPFDEALKTGAGNHPGIHNAIGRRLNQAVCAYDYAAIDPSGAHDSTDGFQQMFRDGAGKTIEIPAGIYHIKCNPVGVNIASLTTVVMAKGAQIKVIPTALDNYALFRIANASHVSVYGGDLVGDRDQHLSEVGQWGMGIQVEASTDIELNGIYAHHFWGDGLYTLPMAGVTCQRIRIVGCRSEYNRRAGLSVTGGSQYSILSSSFSYNADEINSGGINFECDYETDSIFDVTVHDVRCTHNRNGLLISNEDRNIENIRIANSSFYDNDKYGVLSACGIDVVVSASHARQNGTAGFAFDNYPVANILSHSIAKDNGGGGTDIHFMNGATKCLVIGCLYKSMFIHPGISDVTVINSVDLSGPAPQEASTWT